MRTDIFIHITTIAVVWYLVLHYLFVVRGDVMQVYPFVFGFLVSFLIGNPYFFQDRISDHVSILIEPGYDAMGSTRTLAFA